MSIGKRIKECREKVGLTQEELAKLLGVSKGAIGNYESDASYPKIENMTKLFDILKTDANFLFQDDMVVSPREILSFAEQVHIKKYRELDSYGKDTVNTILNKEHKRCMEQAEQKSNQSKTGRMLHQKIVAFGGRNSEKEVSEDELKKRFEALRNGEEE